MTTAEEFQRLAGQLRNEQSAYILAEMNDLLANASGSQIESFSEPAIAAPR